MKDKAFYQAANNHANLILRTCKNMLEAGRSDEEVMKFYTTATEIGTFYDAVTAAVPEPVTNVVKPKVDDPLLAQFRKEYPGAPAAAPASAEPRANVAANTPLNLLAQFRGEWPGQPEVTK